eukprot:CAMPEP_0194359606 /NCGR_PEP_ID=MMETSP0174-20130528/6873_1 /TAXON_ID=216777 /ORGANISM="Proboscia alata, Strain PI-D3" /LENGTH=1110 /DNA_ID=CAMNT_0039130599 /DNA_START=209 /DNA_END=3538 /DNA_ORIENTATION=+
MTTIYSTDDVAPLTVSQYPDRNYLSIDSNRRFFSTSPAFNDMDESYYYDSPVVEGKAEVKIPLHSITQQNDILINRNSLRKQQFSNRDTITKRSEIDETSLKRISDHILHLIPVGELAENETAKKSAFRAIGIWCETKPMTVNAATYAEQLLNRLVEEEDYGLEQRRLYSREGEAFSVKTSLYNMVMGCWSKCHRPENVESILTAMESRASKQDPLDTKPGSLFAGPNIVTYNLVIDAWCKSGDEMASYKAEEMLERIERMYEKNNENDVSSSSSFLLASYSPSTIIPETWTYNTVINTVATDGNMDSAERAENIFLRMAAAYRNGNSRAAPDTITFNTIIKAHSRSDMPGSAQRAEDILNSMITLNDDGHSDLLPNAISFNSVIDAWAKSGEPEAGERGEQLLRLFQAMSEKGLGVGSPNNNTFNAVLSCYAKSGTPEAIARAQELLQSMEERFEQGDYQIQPNKVSYSTVIDALSRQADDDAADTAEELVQRMKKRDDGGAKYVKPNIVTYNSLLHVYQASGNAKKAQNLLFDMENMNDIEPDAISYNYVINAWLNSNETIDTRHFMNATNVLKRMEQSYRNKEDGELMHGKSYNRIINAVARMGWKKIPDKEKIAQKLLFRLDQGYDEGWCDCGSDTKSYNAVLSVLHKSEAKDAFETAKELVSRMGKRYDSGKEDVAPDVITYTTLLHILSETPGQNLSQAEKILARMENLVNNVSNGKNVRPNTLFYNAFLNVLMKSQKAGSVERADDILRQMEKMYQEGAILAKPDIISYNTVIRAFSMVGTVEALKVAEGILDRMLHQVHLGNTEFMPDNITFNTILDGYSRVKSVEAAHKGQKLIERMCDLQGKGIIECLPDKRAFNTSISSWARSRNREGLKRAIEITEMMERLGFGGNEELKPNIITYTSLINAWIKCESDSDLVAMNAEKILHHILREHEQGNSVVIPDIGIFNSVINAIAKSNNPKKASKAQELCMRMNELHIAGNVNLKPDGVTYNSVLNACQYTKGTDDDKKNALYIGLKVFDTAKKESKNDSLSYGAMLGVLNNLMTGQKDTKTRLQSTVKVFKTCCAEGKVSDQVVQNLRRRMPNNLFSQLTSGKNISDFPPEW